MRIKLAWGWTKHLRMSVIVSLIKPIKETLAVHKTQAKKAKLSQKRWDYGQDCPISPSFLVDCERLMSLTFSIQPRSLSCSLFFTASFSLLKIHNAFFPQMLSSVLCGSCFGHCLIDSALCCILLMSYLPSWVSFRCPLPPCCSVSEHPGCCQWDFCSNEHTELRYPLLQSCECSPWHEELWHLLGACLSAVLSGFYYPTLEGSSTKWMYTSLSRQLRHVESKRSDTSLAQDALSTQWLNYRWSDGWESGEP